MFCFQCEQTAACKGCTGKAGVCGKPAAVADLQDQLTGALTSGRPTGSHGPGACGGSVSYRGWRDGGDGMLEGG